jgi:hypothetical protein
MKNFLRKTFFYITAVIFSIQIISIAYIKTDFLYGILRYPGFEIYSALNKSKLKSTKKTLLLGDSVGKQLFPDDNEYYNSLTTNQALGIPGNYFLLKNYLKAGNSIESLVIIYVPHSFKNNLNNKLTYHYFLKPFFNEDYNKYFTKKLLEQIEKIPNKNYLVIPSIKATTWAPSFPINKKSIFELTDESRNTTNEKPYNYLSPISVQYLDMIKDLSIKHDFNIKLLSPPISVNKKINLDSFQKEIQKTNLIEEFEFYIKNLNYIDSKYFSDEIHLNNKEAINYHATKINLLIL